MSRTWEQAIEALQAEAEKYSDSLRGEAMREAVSFLQRQPEPYAHQIAQKVRDELGDWTIGQVGSEGVVEEAAKFAYEHYIMLDAHARRTFLNEVLEWFGWEPYEGPDPYSRTAEQQRAIDASDPDDDDQD